MSDFEVPEAIICSPFDEPLPLALRGGRDAVKRRADGRRSTTIRNHPKPATAQRRPKGTAIELKLVNLIRERVKAWRDGGYPGVTATTLELLRYWRRDGRSFRFFFAQLEAAETIIFLNEARRDFLQGIEVPRDEPSDDQKADRLHGFRRYACKMATGSGKTTVMGMLAAWSILNKVNDRADARFSDVVLVVCPNVTIRSRLASWTPKLGDASLYRKRDLVPPHLMPDLSQGRVLVTNWHVFEPQTIAGRRRRARRSSRRAGVRRCRRSIIIGAKTTTARGKRVPDARGIRAAGRRSA